VSAGAAPDPDALTALTALARSLSRPGDLGTALDGALATVADVLGLETGWVWLIDENSPEPRLAAARALPALLREHPAAMRGDCYCLQTFRKGDLRGAANVNVVWCSRLEQLLDDDEEATDLRCHASVPLAVGHRHLGMLNVASRDWRVLSQPELNLLTTAGALVSLVIERARLEAGHARAQAVEERNQMAREIHDTLAQGLAALTLQLEVADSLAEKANDARLAQAINHALGLARTTLDDARRSVLELRAAPLADLSLARALAALVAEHPAAELQLVDWDDAAPLSRALQIGLYRIAQQALNNAARHARARRTLVRLARTRTGIAIRIEDDGIGFDAAAIAADRFGLLGMNERARLLGGQLTVQSEPGVGTVIQVDVPRSGERSG
jgi:two-component system NarL family sensor kinase